MAVVVTAGQRAQTARSSGRCCPGRPVRTRRPRTRPDRVLADKAYSSKANRAHLRRRGIAATIPVKADQLANRKAKGSTGGRPPVFDPHAVTEITF